MRPPIWQRLIFTEALKVVLFFLVCFTLLYVLIDYSIHAKGFSSAHFTFPDLCLYYLCHFAMRAQILIPFALMLGTVKVLCGLNTRRELVALFSSGLCCQTLIKPLLLLALFCIMVLYTNEEVFLPLANDHLKRVEENYFAHNSLDLSERYLHSITMQDGSTLIYQYFEPSKNALFDVFWVQDSGNRITRMKMLYPIDIPQGEFVDIMKRGKEGKLSLTSSFEKMTLPDLHLDKQALEEARFEPSGAPISLLFKKMGSARNKDQQAEISAQLIYKILIPFTALLAVILPAAPCLRFSRKFPLFLTYAASIFGFIFLITIIDAALIVGENNILSPIFILSIIIIPLFIITFKQYFNLGQL